jgi:hypothetical protein
MIPLFQCLVFEYLPEYAPEDMKEDGFIGRMMSLPPLPLPLPPSQICFCDTLWKNASLNSLESAHTIAEAKELQTKYSGPRKAFQ